MPMSGGLLAWLGAVTFPTVAIGVAVGLLLAAAWHDFRTRLIPDEICVAIAVFGCVFRLQVGLIDFAFSAIVSLLLFFQLFAAFNRGVLGGGDVKLMVAAGLWLSPPDCYVLIVVTAMAGGVLAVLHLLLRSALGKVVSLPQCATAKSPGGLENDAGVVAAGAFAPSASSQRMRSPQMSIKEIMQMELGRIQAGHPLPYGVAIAIGACYAMITSLGG